MKCPFLANPLQYPMFSPPNTLGTPPWGQVNSVVLTRGRAPGEGKIQEQCPTMPTHGASKPEQIPYQLPVYSPGWEDGACN